jgi:uncharacterized membrane protein HdeD (DUF308 family)
MSMNRLDIEQMQTAMATSLHEHWRLFLVEGIILVVLGFAAIVIPPIATLAVELLFGWLFLISGLVGAITTFMMRRAPGYWWSLVSAILAIAVGVVMLLSPLGGVLTLTVLLITFFIIEGVVSVMFAFEHKRELSGRWGWMLASGIIDLILAAIIIEGLPGTAAWALGLLVGINMVFGGTALIGMALHAREVAVSARWAGRLGSRWSLFPDRSRSINPRLASPATISCRDMRAKYRQDRPASAG